MLDTVFKYNYVIFGAGGYYLYGYRDIMSLSNVVYHSSFYEGFKSFFSQQIVRLNFSKRVNSFVKNPFECYVNPRLYPFSFVNNKPICFLYFVNYYILNSSYIDYLHRTYPSAKHVLFFQDLVESNGWMDVAKMREFMDLLISYDMGDCKKYGLEFHPTPMSKVFIPTNNELEESDIYFCGYAKCRYPIIHKLYKEYCKLELKCDFNLMGMPSNIEKIDGIKYHDKPFTYLENLQHVIKSKCILEIMQDGADGFTPRLWEAIMYDRHLLTNNQVVKTSNFFQSEAIHDIAELGSSDICSILERPVSWDETSKNKLSPIHLLQFIDKKIC